MSDARRPAGPHRVLTTSSLPGDLVFISYAPPTGCEPERFSRDVYASLAALLVESDCVLLSERLFGDATAAESVLRARKGLLASAGSRVAIGPTFIEGRPCRGRGMAGLQALALRSTEGGTRRPLTAAGTTWGQLVEGQDALFLMLSDVGQHVRAVRSLPPAEETRLVLAAAEEALASCGWSFQNVRRTWFYLHGILAWYSEFNQVRNAAFRRMGLIDGASLPTIPASTGIEGRNVAGGACTLDLLATAPRGERRHEVRRLAHAKQNEATAYGSAFARGLSLRLTQAAYVFVSGTASIDEHGKTAHVGDFEAQVRCSLAAVQSVLGSGGASVGDICQGTAFLKHADDFETYQRVAAELGFSGLPIVSIVADVCRDDLLFELDATAVLP
jgi:enamine deaminase RidA (YjgF/YER057c/UK114 family)